MKLERLSLYTSNRPVDTVLYWKESGGLLLDPPYQRGDVWGPTRRRNLIRSLLLGIPIPSIVINDRQNAGWDMMISCAVIDGKQRITAILMFLEDRLSVPVEWFGLEGDIVFSCLPIAQQRKTPVTFSLMPGLVSIHRLHFRLWQRTSWPQVKLPSQH